MSLITDKRCIGFAIENIEKTDFSHCKCELPSNFVNGHTIWGYLIMKLTGNTILITGGAGGIGYELTKQLTALGNTILITGRDQAKMDRA
jgi:hypothetical protein